MITKILSAIRAVLFFKKLPSQSVNHFCQKSHCSNVEVLQVPN